MGVYVLEAILAKISSSSWDTVGDTNISVPILKPWNCSKKLEGEEREEF